MKKPYNDPIVDAFADGVDGIPTHMLFGHSSDEALRDHLKISSTPEMKAKFEREWSKIETGKVTLIPATYEDALKMRVVTLEARNAELEIALREAHRVILHEMDNGRTPYMLKAENGGKGLGYFEDVLGGVKRG